MKFYAIKTAETSPYVNLAAEEFLFCMAEKERCGILFLWQNKNAIILGRNQNPSAEYNSIMAERFGCDVARRLTGGGTVYHDMGNLNFSFILPERLYDSESQLKIIQNAVLKSGINAEIGGRNDIYVSGKKISGSAFYKGSICRLHHGTMLVHTDLERMDLLLNTDGGKIKKRGIQSVHAHVCNLREFVKDLTIDEVEDHISECFINWIVGKTGNEIEYKSICAEDIPDMLLQKYASSEWIYGNYKEYDRVIEGSFYWGELKIAFDTEDGKITDVSLSTDSMKPKIICDIEEGLLGTDLDRLQINEFFSCVKYEDEDERQIISDINMQICACL